MIEQPLPAGNDAISGITATPDPNLCRWSCRDSSTLHGVVGRYDMINIKLDKTGGLTEAARTAWQAEAGYERSWSVACWLHHWRWRRPLVAQSAQVVDLDGPLLLQKIVNRFDYSDK